LEACVDEILKWQDTEYLRKYLLEIGVHDSEPWIDNRQSNKKLRFNLWKTLFVETAYLAAMFHDMGYPWQYINILSNKIEHAGYQPHSMSESTEKFIAVFGDRLFFCPFNGYHLWDRNKPSTWNVKLSELIEKSLRKTHGFPGAIGFLYLNDVLRDYPSDKTHPIKQFCVEWAAMAIMMHDMSKIYWGKETTGTPDNPHMRLKFHVDPLSCMQEFSRPVASFTENSDKLIEIKYSDWCLCSCLKTDPISGDTKISYGYDDANKRALKIKYISKDQHEYFNRQYGFLDLSALGINNVAMRTCLLS
jgi:hypothetical protein